MRERIFIREYQKADHKALENVVREAWKYDRFCSSKTAAKMAKAYLNSCLINQTFTRVAEINGEPAGIIMGKDIQNHKCPFSLRIKWIQSIVSLYASKEGRKISKIFERVKKSIGNCSHPVARCIKGNWHFLRYVKSIEAKDWAENCSKQLLIT